MGSKNHLDDEFLNQIDSLEGKFAKECERSSRYKRKYEPVSCKLTDSITIVTILRERVDMYDEKERKRAQIERINNAVSNALEMD